MTTDHEVTITHNETDGTIVEGTDRSMAPILKSCGYRWSRNIGSGAWYLPQSRYQPVKQWKVDALAAALRDAGTAVTVEIDAERIDIAEREELRAESLTRRQEALDAKADRLASEADARFAKADAITEMIPFGQPILVGHHSEKRHRRDLERRDSNLRKGVEAYKDSAETARRADASRSNQDHRESLGTTMRRIEKFEAELRGHQRRLAGKPCPTAGRHFKAEADVTVGESKICPLCKQPYVVTEDRAIGTHYMYDHDAPPTGASLDRCQAAIASAEAEIAYWKAHVASLEDQGVKVWGPADFAKGDFVQHRFGWREIVRVNAKTLSVKTAYSWTDKIAYSEVTGQRRHRDPESELINCAEPDCRATFCYVPTREFPTLCLDHADDRSRQAHGWTPTNSSD